MADELWVGTSWKMTKTITQGRAWAREVAAVPVPDGVTAFVLPPHTALAAVRGCVPPGHRLLVGAQDAHWSAENEWTGEVSVQQVADAGADLVEVGHSERRLGLGEDEDVVARKVRAVVDFGLVPLLCVGEPAAVRQAGAHVDHVAAQVTSALALLEREEVYDVLVAYEPVWAIGPKGAPAEPEDVAPVIAAIREAVGRSAEGASALGVLYGGSVTRDNATAMVSGAGVDGLFVGRAGWTARSFLDIVSMVGRHAGDR